MALARARDLDLTSKERQVLVRYGEPRSLQAYINSIPINHELEGDTCYTVRQVLRYRRAHCIEAALVAACALWLHGEAPLIMDMRARGDWDHVVALFRRGGLWGAIAKSNHVALRGRDPVYRTLRELALSYFHEYHNERGERTLREYSRAFDLRTIAVEDWVTGEAGAWEAERRVDLARHYPLIPASQSRYLSPIDAMEWKAKRLVEYPHPHRHRRDAATARLPKAAGAALR
ncbi:MAG: hypothetical protein EHM59_13795 [Betaproteobacteria bacterium]|nr:MAG: hypothetical protein EHM59_13795 [Betaproteobacteria bacterium]